jgi:intracellular septation protein
MSDATGPQPSSQQPGLARLLVDVGPLVIWIIAYNVASRTAPDEAVYIATGVYMAATLAAAAYAVIREKRMPLMLAVTAVIVVIFGGATLIFHNATFAYVKPTIIYSLFAVGIFGSLAVRQNVLKSLLGSAFNLPERAWRIYGIRWGLWFVFLAILNEVIWRNFSEQFWANSKLGFVVLVLLFSFANMPFILKHQIEPEPPTDEKTGPAD